MRRVGIPFAGVLGVVLLAAAMTIGASATNGAAQSATARARLSEFDRVIFGNALRQLEEGRRIFRFDTSNSRHRVGVALVRL